MYKIPEETLAYWRSRGMEPFSDADIALLKSTIGMKIPQKYLEFAKLYGSVEFDFDIPSKFDYTYEQDGFSMSFSADLGCLIDVELILKYYEGTTTDKYGEGFPKFPPIFLPVGFGLGQDLVLLELMGPKERVWYAEDHEEAWGFGNNVRLGLIADDFPSFIHGLYVG